MSVYSIEQTTGYAFEVLTVTNGAAVPLTSARYKPTANPLPAGTSTMGATRVFITVETAQVRYRYDGIAPTTAIGHLLNPGDNLKVEGEGSIANLQFIATTGTNSGVAITYETG